MRNMWLGLNIGWLGLLGIVVLTSSCSEQKPPNPPEFRVRGTITGLAGSITLHLNETENLTQEDNGPFSFDSQLEDQSVFTVTIAAAPATQECTLENATGKVNGADVDSVRVSCAQRTYALGGTVEGLGATLQLRFNESETLPITTSGRFTFQTRLPSGSAYAVTVAVQPQGHRCSILNGSGTMTGNVDSLVVRCTPWFNLFSSQPAAWVIGQANPTSGEPNRGGSADQDTLAAPRGNPTLAGGKFYISEVASNRILGFTGLPRQNIAPAEFVLGQPDYTSTTERQGETGLASPAGTSSDGTRLAIADKSNSRVLLHLKLPTSSDAPANIVLGQPDFISKTAQCGRDSLNFPEDVFIGHGKLIVADTGNNRILIWNAIPSSTGASPDLVLGQTTFSTCAANDKDSDGVLDANRLPSASTLWEPGGVWTDGNRLVVADSTNNRVLIWDPFPTSKGKPADIVLGQVEFNTRTGGTSQTSLNSPSFITSTGLQLFVADTSNHRVLVWNDFPTSNNTLASVVLGQPNFISNNESDPPRGTSPSAQSLYLPGGVLLMPPYVVVADTQNNRLVVFESP